MKRKINLTNCGINNISILNYIDDENLKNELLQCLDNDKKFFSILWDNYDICFNREPEDTLPSDIYSNESYTKNSVEYNFVLDKIIREYHSFNKNGHNIRQIKVWG